MIKTIFGTAPVPILLCRITVGLIFLSEGIQKFIRPEDVGAGRFAKIGFPQPAFWAHFTGGFEIVCGFLILLGFATRLACIPLLTIMLTAFVTTKIPVLLNKGFWVFAHEYRTDFAMTLLLIFLFIYGGGRRSVDRKITKSFKRKPYDWYKR